jgi:hypothetical protein
LSWLRIGTGGGLLWMRWWTFGFHKMQGISWLAGRLLASREGLCSMELVRYVFIIGVTWGGGKGGKCPLQCFFILGIVFLVTELNNGK